jgi:hypothetical protein
VVQHALDQAGGFGPRQAKAAMDDVGEVRTRQSIRGVRVVSHPSDPEIGHDYLPPSRRAPRRFDYAFVTEFRPVGNSTIAGYSKLFNT